MNACEITANNATERVIKSSKQPLEFLKNYQNKDKAKRLTPSREEERDFFLRVFAAWREAYQSTIIRSAQLLLRTQIKQKNATSSVSGGRR